jgi:hypothetical protein
VTTDPALGRSVFPEEAEGSRERFLEVVEGLFDIRDARVSCYSSGLVEQTLEQLQGRERSL